MIGVSDIKISGEASLASWDVACEYVMIPSSAIYDDDSVVIRDTMHITLGGESYVLLTDQGLMVCFSVTCIYWLADVYRDCGGYICCFCGNYW